MQRNPNPAVAALLFLVFLLPGCRSSATSQRDHYGPWEVVDTDPPGESAPDWTHNPLAGKVVGFGETWSSKRTARSIANKDLVKQAADTTDVQVTGADLRRDTESSSKFLSRRVVRVNARLSIRVTEVYFEERVRHGMKGGQASRETKYRYWVQGIPITK